MYGLQYRPTTNNLAAVVQLTRKIEAIYICACARHGVRDISLTCIYLELRTVWRHTDK